MSNNVDLYYVHLFNDFSGSPRVLRDAIESQVTLSSNTYVFTSAHRGFLDDIDAHKVTCFYARSTSRYIQLFYYLLSQLLLFIQLSSYLLLSRLKGRKSTVVVNTMLPFGALLAGKLVGSVVVSYIHETYIKPVLLKRFLRVCIEHCANHVIFVSKYLQSVESFSKPTQTTIYNGIRSDFSLTKKVDKTLKFSEKKLFFAGSLKEYKGIEQLFELAQSLPEFEVMAALNCSDNELSRFVQGRCLPENITLLARPPDIERYFGISFAVLNLTLPDQVIETFGLSLMEGMACGSPVVAPAVGGPIEFVNSSNGFLVDARNTGEIVKFLRYLNSSLDIWILFSDQAFLTSKKFTNSVFQRNFKLYFEEHNLL
ncbi:hypothetical protein BCU98_07210 [Vibrio splendidus]|uniref:glycosyltransferase family 4 protein n=1 Tax=Vibrio splendidus TaxID=29497 RepID=UPI000C844B72|nr:glycosyltransferase family 4 protein [Vibrio splendidus]PMG09909.1 hypothetical protein BCU98_07210 [Vibrio splendidus]